MVRIEANENETCEHIADCIEFDELAIVMSRYALLGSARLSRRFAFLARRNQARYAM